MSQKSDKQYTSSIPDLSRRIISTLIDAVIAFSLLVCLLNLIDASKLEIPFIKLFALVIAVSYEPLLSVFGCTVGQWFVGIRVRSYNTGKRPTIFEAYLRYFYKVVIGWKSLLFYSKEHERLIHDNIAGTIVVMKSALPRL